MRRSAVGVMNGNYRNGDYYRYRNNIFEPPAPKRDIVDELLDSMKMANTAKRNDMSWSRHATTGRQACIFCSAALRRHKRELDLYDQLILVADVVASHTECLNNLVAWQDETEATRKSDYPV